MDTGKDIWELVRQKIDIESDSSKKDYMEEIEKKEDSEEFIDSKIKTIENEKEPVTDILKSDFGTIKLFDEGIFAGFIYIFTIMVVLGVLTIPGSITAAIGGFFGGRKAGDPARALTAAMLPFLVIATAYLLASSGALPPGSGPNDIADKTQSGQSAESGQPAQSAECWLVAKSQSAKSAQLARTRRLTVG